MEYEDTESVNGQLLEKIEELTKKITSLEAEKKYLEESGKKTVSKGDKQARMYKGYYKPEEIKETEKESNVECFVGVVKDKKGEIKFQYDKSKDEYECSEGGGDWCYFIDTINGKVFIKTHIEE